MTVEEWLIDAVRERPIIWNTNHENYKNTKLKNEAYDEIAKESNKPVSEIKRKWHSIRSAFSRELRMRSLYTNVGSNEKRQWKHFQKLMFLHEEGQVEMEEEMESDYTIHLVEQDDGSSSLIATNQTIDLPNASGQTENVTAILNLENGQSSPGQTASKRGKKRKTNAKSNGTSGGPSTASNAGAYEPILTAGNFEPATTPRNSLIGRSGHYSPQPLSEEEIFGHSIAASLKKFDAKQKEIVKLRLQEVIVQHLTEN